MTVAVHANDPEGDRLVYWADGLPGGAIFDPDRQTLTWTPDFHAAGTYTITFTVSDGLHQVSGRTTLLIARGNAPPTLVRPADVTVGQGDPVRIRSRPARPTATHSLSPARTCPRVRS